MYHSVKNVKPLKNMLLLNFDNGEVKIFDMKPYLEQGLFKELNDESFFNSVHVSLDTVEWSNGVDICPEIFYEQSVKFENCA